MEQKKEVIRRDTPLSERETEDLHKFEAAWNRHRQRMLLLQSLKISTMSGVISGLTLAAILNGWSWAAAVVEWVKHWRYVP
jgi:hypothetical protein